MADTFNLGKSRLVPYKGNESKSDRHDRRKDFNLNRKKHVSNWCQKSNIQFKINNDGHHWSFKKGINRADWYPSSAKLVINQKWDLSIHCHDYQKLIDYLEKRKVFK